MIPTNLKDCAYTLLKTGKSIFPIGKDKKPLISSWQEFQTRRPSVEEVDAWFKRWPDMNYALVTGKISGIAVVDIDPRHGGVLDDRFPQKTTMVKTGNGGYHLYYKWKEGITNKTNIFPGVDVRGEGGYVVGPCSVTDYLDKGVKMGGEYSLMSTLPFLPFPFDLGHSGASERQSMTNLVSLKEGSRNDSLTSVVGKLLLTTNPEKWNDEIYPVVCAVNNTYDPPLDVREVNTIYRSICNKELQRRAEMEKEKSKIKDERVKSFLTKVEKEISTDLPEDEQDEARKRLLEVAKIYSGEDMLESSEEISKRLDDEPEELKIMSGFQRLDSIVKGFRIGQLVIVSGYTKHGKSNFTMDMTSKLKEYHPVWFPLEMGSEEMVRIFKERKQEIPYFLSPRTVTAVSLEWIESKIVEGIAKYNSKIVMIDQLDFIVPLQMKDHHQMIGETVRAVRSLARKWGVTIFLICHLNGQAKMTQAPSMENLKGSTSIQQEADIVLMVWRETEKKNFEFTQTNNTMILVQANRRGGTTGNVKMVYNPKDGHYYEREWETSEEHENRMEEEFKRF
jgi:replicative DNA helicase